MAEFTGQRPIGPERLTLYFDNERPIPAVELGRMLTELASDYRRFSRGNELIIVEVHEGSLKLVLGTIAAAVTIAAGANELLEFAGRIDEMVQRAQAGEPVLYGGSRRVGARSAQSILDTAVASKSRFHLQYRSPEGEHLVIEMDAPHAERVQQQALTARADIRRIATPQETKRLSPPLDGNEKALDETIERLLSDHTSTPQSDQAVALAISLLVEALATSGSTYAINEVARKLDARGYPALARMVRNRPSGGAQTVQVGQ
jgi:hypothetical protein